MATGCEILPLRSALVKISKISFLHLCLKTRRAEVHTVSQRKAILTLILQYNIFYLEVRIQIQEGWNLGKDLYPQV